MKILLIYFCFFALSLKSQPPLPTKAYQVDLDGKIYRVTGSEGTVFSSDGSTDFMGTKIFAEATEIELIALGGLLDTMVDLTSYKVNCSAGATWVPNGTGGVTAGGGSVWLSIFHNKCGPMTFTPIPGGQKQGCMNSNSYLCGFTLLPTDKAIIYLGDCN